MASSTSPVGALTWRVHPLRELGVGGLLLLVVLALMGFLSVLWIGQAPFAMLVLLVFFWSMRDILLPQEYVLTGEGFTIRDAGGVREDRWDRFRGLTVLPRAVKLRRMKARSLSDEIRGVTVILESTRRDEILRFIAGRIGVAP